MHPRRSGGRCSERRSRTARSQRLSNTPMIDRMALSKDLGEELVMAHAVVQAGAGADVVMLIDEIRGAAAATLEVKRLERLTAKGHAVGSLRLYSTLTVLKAGIGTSTFPIATACEPSTRGFATTTTGWSTSARPIFSAALFGPERNARSRSDAPARSRQSRVLLRGSRRPPANRRSGSARSRPSSRSAPCLADVGRQARRPLPGRP